MCYNYCCWNVAVPEVPETILPRGHLHRPPLFRHACDDGSVVYFQSRSVPMALTANAGTEVTLGSSGPAQRRAVRSEIYYNQKITQAEFISWDGKNINLLPGDFGICGTTRIIWINPHGNNIKLLFEQIWDIRNSQLVAYFSWPTKFHRLAAIEKFLY